MNRFKSNNKESERNQEQWYKKLHD
jgi:hypothetical protein